MLNSNDTFYAKQQIRLPNRLSLSATSYPVHQRVNCFVYDIFLIYTIHEVTHETHSVTFWHPIFCAAMDRGTFTNRSFFCSPLSIVESYRRALWKCNAFAPGTKQREEIRQQNVCPPVQCAERRKVHASVDNTGGPNCGNIDASLGHRDSETI